ncbi:MAG TPA: hypothetical protein DCM14_00215 [Clostridiales bacterium UBA8153]|nr:hypothetical protein [Clostridiales bacterium UBA8153]
MKLRFVKMSPAGNTTVFVLDPVPLPEQVNIALALMDPAVLGGEQVGFVTLCPAGGPPGTGLGQDGPSPEIAALLRMMGGEFCGNAARALGAYLAYKRFPGLSWAGDVARGLIQVSGATAPIEFEAQVDRNGLPGRAGCRFPGPFRVLFYQTRVALEGALVYERCSGAGSLSPTGPDTTSGSCKGEGYELVERAGPPETGANQSTELTARAQGAGTPVPDAACRRQTAFAVVHMPGIVHIVLAADDYAPAEEVLFRLRSVLRLEGAPCVGVMFCSGLGPGCEREDRHGDLVVPLVHVPATDTTVWESSCASGAVAVALARAAACGRPGRFMSKQPGGNLDTTVDWDVWQSGQGVRVRLEGEVRLVAEGEVLL